MQFSLKNIKGTSNVQPKLKGNEIHTVVFKGVTYSTFKGKKDENQTYQVMKLRFENQDGYYEETVFAPKEGDDKRQANTVNGVERENPSNLEKLHFLMAHVGEQLAPAKYTKFHNLEFDLPKDFEKMVKTFIEVTKDAVNKTTKLKLLKNKKGEAILPYFVGLSKEGEAFISNNFLGDKVFFTEYELKRMEEATEAKPTDMGSEIPGMPNVDEVSSNSDLDFDVNI